jgi:hypothetical protein
MLDRGLTEDGAAQALGWPKNRVTARVKILELPERAQQLIGEDVIALAAVDQLRAIGAVAPELLDAVIVVARGVAAGVGLHPGAIDRDDPDLGQPGPRAQAEHRAEQPGQRPLVTLDEPGDRRVIGLGVRGDHAVGDALRSA